MHEHLANLDLGGTWVDNVDNVQTISPRQGDVSSVVVNGSIHSFLIYKANGDVRGNWSGGIDGKLSDNNQTITWSNGYQWFLAS